MGPTDNVYENYLLDLGDLIKAAALDAQKTAKKTNSDFDVGSLMAYHSVVSLMQNQALAFGIDLKKLKLNDIDPMRDLLSTK